MASLLGLRRVLPYDEIFVLTDSNGPSGLKADGTAGFDPAQDTPHPLCFENRNCYQDSRLNFTTQAINPMAFSNATNNSTNGAITFVLHLLKWWAANRLQPGRRVRATCYGIGGITLASVMSGGSQAPLPIARFNASLAENAGNTPVLFVSCLGTNDSISGTSKNAMDTDIGTMDTTYRGAGGITGAGSLPMVFLRSVPGWVATSPYAGNPAATGTFGGVDESIRTVGSRLSKAAAIDPTGITGQTATAFHYNDADHRLIGGTAIGNALGNLSA